MKMEETKPFSFEKQKQKPHRSMARRLMGNGAFHTHTCDNM